MRRGYPTDLGGTAPQAARHHRRHPQKRHKSPNFAMVSRSENREISNMKPSEYRELMPADTAPIQEAAMLPDSLFADNYDNFLPERAEKLVALARARAGLWSE